MAKQTDTVEKLLLDTMSAIRDTLADGRSKSIVYTKVEEALLWLKSDELFFEMKKK